MNFRLIRYCFFPIAVVVVLPLVSCGGNIDVDQECINFIDDRTFCICGYNDDNADNKQWARATCWILNKATSEKNDYIYWIATNWHFFSNAQYVKNAKKWGYSDRLHNPTKEIDSYTDFHSFELEDASKFCYGGKVDNLDKAIDFRVARVDFGYPTAEYKNKLDRLNDYWASHNKNVNSFQKDGTDTTHNQPKYIAGYPIGPGDDPDIPKWEYHKIETSSIASSGVETHTIDNYGGHSAEYIDTSPKYLLPGVETTWMDVGASGSMILDYQKKVCGIYWGGPTLDTIFFPQACIFNSSDKNFIANYVN